MTRDQRNEHTAFLKGAYLTPDLNLRIKDLYLAAGIKPVVSGDTLFVFVNYPKLLDKIM